MLYKHDELKKFFARIGAFQTAAAQADRFFQGWNAAQGPPASVVYGPKHGGLESMANYVAWCLKGKDPAKTRFDAVSIIDDSNLSFLQQIDFVMRTHIKENGITGCAALFEVADSRGIPSEAILTQLFTSLAAKLEDAPWLILKFRPIVYKRVGLVEKYWELLTNMRVAPVFMTSDPDVWMKCNGWKPTNILCSKVEALNFVQSIDLLAYRLSQFRVDPAPQVAPEFPYARLELEKLFSDGNQSIGFVLDRYSGAFEEKLRQLEDQGPEADPTVSWTTFSADYRQSLQNAAPPKNP
jgi:hypothetical protein